jgi:cytochrome bd-type quinol oxidase subunit 2
MKQAIWNRVGPVSGVLFFALIMAGTMIHGYPDVRPSDSQLANWMANVDLSQFRVGLYIEAVGILLFVPFVAWLYRRLRQGPRDSSWPAITMLAAGAGWVAFTLPVMGGWAGLAEQARKGLDIRAAQTVVSINQASYDLTGIVLGLTLMAAGAAIVRGGAMSQWVGWAAIVIGVIHVVAMPLGIGASPAALLGYLWLVAVAVYYTFRPVREVAAGAVKQSVASGLPAAG